MAAKKSPKVVTVTVKLPAALYRRFYAMAAYDEHESFDAAVVALMEREVEIWLDTEGRPMPFRFLAKWLQEHHRGAESIEPPAAKS